MAVHCRSQEEANRVYHFQPFIRRIERGSLDDVVNALLSNTELYEAFGESIPGENEFYAALYNREKRPTIFFSW